MATKKPAAKAQPKATKTVTTSTGKTKTMPARKPATKPTLKTAKTTKPARTTSNTTSAKAKKPGEAGRIIACIIGAIAFIALVSIVIVMVVNSMNNKGDSSLVVEDGEGNKIKTQYVAFNDNGFRIKVPTDFHALNDAEIKAKYPNESPSVVYANQDNTVNIAISPSDSALTNDQIKTYLDTMKSIFAVSGEVLKTDYYTQGKYNIATIQLVSKANDGSYYNSMAFFSQDDKLVIVTFNCPDTQREQWQSVSDFVIKSLDFMK